jgi:hypothetical protein
MPLQVVDEDAVASLVEAAATVAVPVTTRAATTRRVMRD